MGDAAVAQANATVDIVHEIATILDTGLSKQEVAIIIALIENGVNPQASLILAFSPVLQLLLLKLSRWVHLGGVCSSQSVRSRIGKPLCAKSANHCAPPRLRLRFCNVQALAEVVKQLKREAAALRAQHQATRQQEASA